jgi:hypothetical protein
MAYNIFLYKIAENEIENFKSGRYDGNNKIADLIQRLSKNEKVKTQLIYEVQNYLKDITYSKYFKYKNIALVKYGWAMTVHKALYFKWDDILFNVDWGESAGKTNESYFKWLYSGLSRAEKKAYLINYKPISPFDKTKLIDQSSSKKFEEHFYITKSKDVNDFSDELKKHINAKLSNTNIEIVKIDNYDWQKKIYFSKGNEKAIVVFYYNSQGIFKKPSLVKSNSIANNLENEIIQLLIENNTPFSFDVIENSYIRSSYQLLSENLRKYDIKFKQITQTSFKDKIIFSSKNDELDIEIDYNGNNEFTNIIAKYYSNPLLWENLIKSIKESME